MTALKQENVATRGSDKWGSPSALVDLLKEEFPLAVDLAAEKATCRIWSCVDGARAPEYFGPDHPIAARRDALGRPWGELDSWGLSYYKWGYLNPPFSLIRAFVEKAVEEMVDGDFATVALLPVKTETQWWHLCIPYADEVRFLQGRLSYTDPDTGEAKDPARFASCVVVWKPRSPGAPPVPPRYSLWDWRKYVKGN